MSYFHFLYPETAQTVRRLRYTATALVLFFYNVALFVLSPLILLVIFVRWMHGKESREHIGQRFGLFDAAIAADTRTTRFWVHAVSVGEVMAAAPVLKELRKRHPDALICLTTTTVGGREVAAKSPDADYVTQFPLDFLPCVLAAVKSVRPTALILMEWEIWGNLLAVTKASGATVAVINGRISDAGLKRGSAARFWLSPALKMVDVFAMQSAEDARRAVSVGAEPSRVHTIGNTKFDESAVMLTPEERSALREDFGIPQGVPVLICGSTRDAPEPATPPEEVLIAEAIVSLAKRLPSLHVIVAPRHIERAPIVENALRHAGNVSRRSRGAQNEHRDVQKSHRDKPKAYRDTSNEHRDTQKEGRGVEKEHRGALLEHRDDPSPPRILLLDTFGELSRAYAVADAAFVGGSLVNRGGQSVFQPLAQGVPAIFGTFMNNQRDIATLAQAEGVGFVVRNAEELAETAHRLLTLPANEKAELSRRCRAVIERNQGVTARALDLLDAARGAK